MNVKEVWDKLKGVFEGKSRSILVDLGRKFQTKPRDAALCQVCSARAPTQ